MSAVSSEQSYEYHEYPVRGKKIVEVISNVKVGDTKPLSGSF
jgi:hypothetical protein